MNEHEDFREIEEILRKQKIKKVPDDVLSDFTEQVMERVRKRRVLLPEFKFRLFRVLVPVTAGVILAVLFLMPREPGEIPTPTPAIVEIAQMPDLTLEEEIMLIEELSDEENGLTEGMIDDEEWLEQELSLLEGEGLFLPT